MPNWDVAVVGAGPAGAWAARQLSARGLRVLMADASHPREKPCGGGVTDRALSIVDGAVPNLPAVRVRAARFLSASGHDVSVPLDATRGLVVASRASFDGCLLQAALRSGATHARTRVIDVARASSGFRLTMSSGEEYCARFVIGADGASGLCRRRLASRFERHQLSVATGFFAQGVTGEAIVIEFVDDPPGYIWSFPRPDHLAIGICAQADSGTTSEALRARAASWIRARGLAPESSLRAYSWPIPSLPAEDVERLPVAGPGWVLVGDAAGLVDPITREGIFFALQSAEYAAEALGSNRSSPEGAYTERIREGIGAELARAARLKAVFFRPRFTRLLVEALAESAGIRRVMADLVAGAQGYRGLKRRLAATWEIGLAARLVFDYRGARGAPRGGGVLE